jgi:Flp pilus assembly pilin Flp
MDTVNRFLLNELGQDLVEYTLLIVFILIATVLYFQQTGSSVNSIWVAGSSTVKSAAPQTS